MPLLQFFNYLWILLTYSNVELGCEIIYIYSIIHWKRNGDASPENYNERVYNWPASSEYSTFEPISDSLAWIY